MKVRYPVYIPSKGRATACHTARTFERGGVPFHVVVEPQDADSYAAALGRERVVVMPENNRGLVYARNFCKDHSVAAGAARHWQFDDDIVDMRRVHRGYRIPVQASLALGIAEEFTERYENIALTSFNNIGFVMATNGVMPGKVPPFYLNVRCYTCFLVLNSLPNRWRGRYNEDTDMTLQVLADGWCTVLFNALVMNTGPTNSGGKKVKKEGGQQSVYADDGRLKMARDLERAWPNVVETVRRFKRPQHRLDWSKFDTPLRRRADVDWDALEKAGANDFGMELRAVREVKDPALRELLDG